MIFIISCIIYLFIGGILNGLISDSDDDANFTAAIFWPIVVSLWIGDEFGKFIKKLMKK